ncbi:substrate-binding domain-containing protein [Mesorhizobium sp. 113-3-3]|uniref:substrate-binding domain-containing protein n=1 Tax=Mesorhizobium sp. 113-3-3 TaxID=2744516 RepID=UPI001925F73A|nr:substrate-binding domain-containing protein [Mesorhizobium sp. 113-3-3]BCG82118.1 sugar ABC transporter substrate-binding protein [Mesorhizobium sp. 113-3-3]
MRSIDIRPYFKAAVVASVMLAGNILAANADALKIGVSNAYVDTWRSQLLDTLNKANKPFVEKGITEDLIVQSGATNVQGQIGQIRSLINAGVNVLFVIPSSETALNPVLQEAVDAGVQVFSITQAVTSPKVYGVMVDQSKWATGHAQWLADTLGGKGDIVLLNGLAGAPANEQRVRTIAEFLKGYPELKVLNTANGDWDVVKAQQVMSSVFAAQPKIDGIWVSGAMSEGVLRALVSANPEKWPAVTGDTNLGYLRLWKKALEKQPSFRSVGVFDPPGIEATAALKIAIKLAEGRKFKDGVLEGENHNFIFVKDPAPMGADKLDAVLAENKDRPDSFFLDYEMPDADIEALFK